MVEVRFSCIEIEVMSGLVDDVSEEPDEET
jgi:hypothetical protein